MKAYLAIKFHADQSNRPTIEGISANLEAQGIETVCVTRDLEQWGNVSFSPAELMQRSFCEIAASDVVIVELSEKGVGLGIEAGYAYAKGIPIITIARSGSDISETLRGITQHVLLYSEYHELGQLNTLLTSR